VNRKPTMMERTRAAREYVNRVPMSAERAAALELAAFMAIFHPKNPERRRRNARQRRTTWK